MIAIVRNRARDVALSASLSNLAAFISEFADPSWLYKLFFLIIRIENHQFITTLQDS